VATVGGDVPGRRVLAVRIDETPVGAQHNAALSAFLSKVLRSKIGVVCDRSVEGARISREPQGKVATANRSPKKRLGRCAGEGIE